MIYRCKHFGIKELVAPELLAVTREEALWRMIGTDRAMALDAIREDYAAAVKAAGYPSGRGVYINGKYCGEIFNYSGVRPLNCKVGAKFSRHQYAEAFDLKARHMAILFKVLRKNEAKYGIVRKENPKRTRTWAHVELYGEKLKTYTFNP